MKKLRIGVFGANGKMGQEIFKLIKADPSLEAAVGVSLDPQLTGYRKISMNLTDELAKEADVWIDFSLSSGFNEILEFCKKHLKPMVSGTTGLNSDQHDQIRTAGEIIPILWSSNMSLGVVALKKAMEAFSMLSNFDFQIEEIHHKMKLDKPSGTAVSLQKKLSEVTQRKDLPEPISIRGGGVFGIHKVWAFSQAEVISFEHQALNREVFAKGALWATRKIVEMETGLYSLEDLFQWP